MSDFVLKWGPALGAGYLKLVQLTSRYSAHGEANVVKARKISGPLVWTVWHNRLLGAIAWHTGMNIGAMISRSRDGELIARAVEKLGYSALRGSSSRGGASALKAIIRHLRSGHDVVITPDGPRGPRYQVQPGAAYAAQKLGVPVLPVGVGAKRKVVFKSWDRFQLPLPFGKVQVVYGEPLTFEPDEPEEEVRRRIGEATMSATLLADELLGVESP